MRPRGPRIGLQPRERNADSLAARADDLGFVTVDRCDRAVDADRRSFDRVTDRERPLGGVGLVERAQSILSLRRPRRCRSKAAVAVALRARAGVAGARLAVLLVTPRGTDLVPSARSSWRAAARSRSASAIACSRACAADARTASICTSSFLLRFAPAPRSESRASASSRSAASRSSAARLLRPLPPASKSAIEVAPARPARERPRRLNPRDRGALRYEVHGTCQDDQHDPVERDVCPGSSPVAALAAPSFALAHSLSSG